jgi:NAD-dependent oxidoreductase involved in siderophore biosynthesis
MRKLKVFPSNLLLGKGRKNKTEEGLELPLVKAEASAQISVQWLSCQNWQGISAKSGFPLSVKKSQREQEKLNSHFKQ